MSERPSSLNETSAGGARIVFRPEVGPAGDVLVAVFLRGGMDGLHAVPPFGDRAYHDARRPLGAEEPRRGGSVALNDQFALHHELAPLEPWYRDGLLAVVQAVGLDAPLLSHFDATRALERGHFDEGARDGWLGRHLSALQAERPSPLRAIALGKYVPPVLRGAEARAITSLADFRLDVPLAWRPGFAEALGRLYARGGDLVSIAGRGTLETIAALERLSMSESPAEHGAVYAGDLFSRQLRQTAQLIKAEVGLEAAVLEIHGWDSHVSQSQNLLLPMRGLAQGLDSFARDLGERMGRVTVVVISEFGRRIAPNAAGGTDHGRATAMLLLGGGIRGGQVYGRWPGLRPDELDEGGNLRVTTDYRHVLAEILSRRLKNPRLDEVFPAFTPEYLGFTA